jgi:hypothetical protein
VLSFVFGVFPFKVILEGVKTVETPEIDKKIDY